VAAIFVNEATILGTYIINASHGLISKLENIRLERGIRKRLHFESYFKVIREITKGRC